MFLFIVRKIKRNQAQETGSLHQEHVVKDKTSKLVFYVERKWVSHLESLPGFLPKAFPGKFIVKIII